MGWRFRRSIKLLPGVKLNIGKKSTSISIGGRGATVNFNKHGTKTTVGIPGTGLSYTNFEKKGERNGRQNAVSSISSTNYTIKDYIFALVCVVIVFAISAFIITSCNNNQREKALAEKIKEETCDPITTDIDWCRNAKQVSLRGRGMLIDHNFEKFMGIKPGKNDYIGHSGINTIKSKTYPNAKYARVFIIKKDFNPVAGTEKTLILDEDFKALDVVDGDLFKNN